MQKDAKPSARQCQIIVISANRSTKPSQMSCNAFRSIQLYLKFRSKLEKLQRSQSEVILQELILFGDNGVQTRFQGKLK